MPGRANSSINVAINGDARSLVKAADKANASIGGINKTALKVAGVLAAGFAADALVDFGNAAVKEGDRVADAIGRIEGQLGPDLSKAIVDRADEFSKLGASEGDMLELEARLIDIGTAAGIAGPKLAPLAEDAAEVAHAMALATDIPADEWIDKIGKAAASGDMRSLRDLGINLDEAAVNAKALADTGKDTVDALTEGEIAAARAAIIMDTLRERYGDVTTAGGDLESKQAELNAKWETLTGKIGPPLEDLLESVLDFVLKGVAGWEQLAAKIGENEKAIRDFLGPLARAVDLLGAMLDLLNTVATFDAFDFTSGGPVGQRVPRLPTGGGLSSGPNTVNVNVQGGSPEAIERAVVNAVNTARRRGELE